MRSSNILKPADFLKFNPVQGRTPAKAVIHQLTGYSAHADQKGLCEWVKSMPELPGEIRLVHGEPEAQKALRSKLNLL